MKKCDWCGRSYKDGDGVWSLWSNFCSRKCKSESEGQGQSNTNNAKSGGGSCLGKIIKWIVIIITILFIIGYLVGS